MKEFIQILVSIAVFSVMWYVIMIQHGFRYAREYELREVEQRIERIENVLQIEGDKQGDIPHNYRSLHPLPRHIDSGADTPYDWSIR